MIYVIMWCVVFYYIVILLFNRNKREIEFMEFWGVNEN